MGISFGSINTGLPKDIVKQLLAAEKIPIHKMEERKAKINEKTQLVNQLTSLIQELRDDVYKNSNAKGLRELSIITNNELIDVVADKDIAEVGEYRLEVVQLAQKSTAMTSGFADPDDSYVGVGFIQYYLPNGESRDIYIDNDHATLKGVASLINSNPNMNMKANIINDGSGSDKPWRLVLSLKDVGDDNFADFPYFYFVDGEDDFYLEKQRDAHDAIVKMDGFEIELPSNKTTELIPGLTIDLKKARPGEEFGLKIQENIQAVTEKMSLIVDKINAVLSFIHEQNSMDEKTDTSRTLGGDLSLQTIESRIRNTVFEPVMTKQGYKRFGDMGFTFQRNGLLQMDKQKFESYISKNYAVSTQILTGYTDEDEVRHDGVLGNFNNIASGFLKSPDGVLNLRKNGLQSTINQIDRQIENRQRIIDQRERLLKDKFSRLEGLVAKIRSQGAGLSSLAQNVDPVTQLGESVS